MASSKPKKSAAKAKASTKTKETAKSTKPESKSVVKAEKVDKVTEKTESKAPEKSESKVSEKVKTEKVKTVKDSGFVAFVKKFFAKKCDTSENILTVFHSKKIYAALIGELIGTMLIAIVLLTLGLYQPLYVFFVVIAATLAVFKLSGANLNPLITAGMMATRRVSAIRGVLYILAQIVGAWLGLVIVNAFRLAAGGEAELPVMTEVAEGMFWSTTLVEFFGATIIGFFFAKAQQYRRSAFTFAVVAAGGAMIAFIAVYLISYNYFGLMNNFMMNPAVALMYQIMPTSGDTFGALLGQVALALVTYVIFPMVGGIIGFFVSDVTEQLNEDEVKTE